MWDVIWHPLKTRTNLCCPQRYWSMPKQMTPPVVTYRLRKCGGLSGGPESFALVPGSWAAMQIRPKLEWELLCYYTGPCWAACAEGPQKQSITSYKPRPIPVNRTTKIKGRFNNKTFIIAQNRAMGGRELLVGDVEGGKSTTSVRRDQQFPWISNLPYKPPAEPLLIQNGSDSYSIRKRKLL